MGIHAAYCSYEEGGECSCGSSAASAARHRQETKMNKQLDEFRAEQKRIRNMQKAMAREPKPGGEINIHITLAQADSCNGCAMSSCGHFGAAKYCEAGFGMIDSGYRDGGRNEFYSIRPKECRDAKGAIQLPDKN